MPGLDKFYTQDHVAKQCFEFLHSQLNISENALSRKISNQNEFKLSEVLAIQKIFNIDDNQREVIFFNLDGE